MKKHNISDMLIYIISAEVIGAVSALLAGGFSDFFNKYEEPPLLPPKWLFPVVWTILYAVMGYSAYLVKHSYGETAQKKTALTIYWTQLALNFMWSIIFFRFEALWLAFVVIMALWVLIIAMIMSFRKISPLAAYINIPYLLWVTFAAYLNLATAIIN
ncbi:MAG: tryptophan-rich sensory protein [Oscillospiraceae bacterium]|nr:tryptophan-rich sensory protein [Oscillospiraceae bacterium]